MRPPPPARRFPVVTAALLWVAVAGGVPGAAAAAPPPFRVALIGAASGPGADAAAESLFGVRAALRDGAEARAFAGRKVAIEIVDLDDGDSAGGATAAMEKAGEAKCHVVLAAATGVTAAPLADAARRARRPLILVAGGGHPLSVDPADPVVSMAAWPVDEAVAAANFLAVHSTKEHIGTFGDCVEPALVHEDTPRGRELADALARNLSPRQRVSGRVAVPPRGAPAAADLAALREARCDRLVLVGEPDLADAVADALAAMRWDVPVFCMDGMLSRAARSAHDGRLRRANFLVSIPQWTMEGPHPVLERAWAATGAKGEAPPRAIRGYTAAEWVLRAALELRTVRGPELLAALRAVPYGPAEAGMPVIDETGRAALPHWYLWRTTKSGPARIEPKFLPQEGFGPLLRMQRADRYAGEPGTKIVHLSFGDEKSRVPRSIEKDMAALGLGTRGYEGEMDAWLLDELMGRTLGKLNRLFLRNYDGTPIPGVSYNISFTAAAPQGLKSHEYWKGVIAGDDPAAGGRAWPGEGRFEIYSTYMIRTDVLLGGAALKPGMNREDRPLVDGTYSWGTTVDQNVRADRIRCLVDGYASFFALTGAHEIGHIAGLGHDEESGRSIMNVLEGAGLRETNAWFIPKHREVLERLLGRHDPRARPRR